jgi:D-sedoheptulose 7-phosphate isomerase
VAAELMTAPGIADAREGEIAGYFQRSCDALERANGDPRFLSAVAAIARVIVDAYRNGGKLLIAGNGGSAGDAQHIAAEFLSRYLLDRQPLPAIALTTDTSVLTAVGNDFGFERVFERQVRGLGRRGDVFLAISTSGRSANVLAALRVAREIGLVTVGFTGSGANEMRGHCDHILCAPSEETAVVQQIYLVAAHAICGVVEHELFARPGA